MTPELDLSVKHIDPILYGLFWVTLVVLVMNSSSSILVFCCSYVFCIALNRNVSCMGTEMPVWLFLNINEFTWFESFYLLPIITNKLLNDSRVILHIIPSLWMTPKSHLPYCIWTFIWTHIMPDVLSSLLLHFALIVDFFQCHFNTNRFRHSTRPIRLLRCQYFCQQYPPR